MNTLLPILWPAALAGIVAVAVTLAIERFGGVVGGLLGTMPTTILPAALGIWVASDTPATFGNAMGSVPVGMLAASLFLLSWRVVPPRLPAWPLRAQLALMVAISLACWSALAILAVALLSWAAGQGVPSWLLGAVALLVNVVIGTWASSKRVPAPPGSRAVSMPALVARGVLAGAAIAVSTLLALTGDGYLAGVASVFPAIFLTTMVGLWFSQGLAVPAGAVGPMMLGATAVGFFALLSTWAFPMLGPGWGSVVAWLVAVCVVTVPALVWLRRRHAAA